jgi:hypothetical protein
MNHVLAPSSSGRAKKKLEKASDETGVGGTKGGGSGSDCRPLYNGGAFLVLCSGVAQEDRRAMAVLSSRDSGRSSCRSCSVRHASWFEMCKTGVVSMIGRVDSVR